VPGECGIHDPARGMELKALCATRSFCMWLGKGVDVMHYFVAYDRNPAGMGILPADLPELPADVRFDQAATAPMRAVRNLTRAFDDSVPLERTRPLSVEVTSLGPQRKIFDGDRQHPPLWHRDVLAVLPFQTRPGKFVVATYVMTYDVTRPMAEERYRLKITGLHGAKLKVALVDPHEDKTTALEPAARGDDFVELTVPVVDHPRLLVLEE